MITSFDWTLAAQEPPVTEEKLLRVGVRLLGAYFVLSSLHGMLYAWARVKLFTADSYQPAEFTSEQKAAIFAYLSQPVAGLLAWLFAGRIVGFTLSVFNGRPAQAAMSAEATKQDD